MNWFSYEINTLMHPKTFLRHNENVLKAYNLIHKEA
jgi:hypothetical protein